MVCLCVGWLGVWYVQGGCGGDVLGVLRVLIDSRFGQLALVSGGGFDISETYAGK